MADQTCSACRHWHRLPRDPNNLGESVIGECREHVHVVVIPQAMRAGMAPALRVLYPPTPEDFPVCGRYEERAVVSLIATSMDDSTELDASENADVPTVEPTDTIATLMTSPSLAPTWKETVLVFDSTLMPLNSAAAPMRSISEASWLTSVWMAACAEALSEPFLYWTASSRTRCSIEWTSSRRLLEPIYLGMYDRKMDATAWWLFYGPDQQTGKTPGALGAIAGSGSPRRLDSRYAKWVGTFSACDRLAVRARARRWGLAQKGEFSAAGGYLLVDYINVMRHRARR